MKHRKITAVLLAVVLVPPVLTGCQRKKTGATLEISVENSFVSECITQLDMIWLDKQIPVKGGVLAIGSVEDEKGESRKQILFANLETGEVRESNLLKETSGTFVDICATCDGTLEVLCRNPESEQTDYWMYIFDSSMQLLEKRDVPPEAEKFSWVNFARDKNGNYMFWTYNRKLALQTVEVFDSDFHHCGSITDNTDSCGYFYYSASGDVYTSYLPVGGAEKLVMVDAEKLEFIPVQLPDTLRYRMYPIAGENGDDFYYPTEKGIYTVNLAKQTAEEVLNWNNSDLSPCSQVLPTGDGGFYVCCTGEGNDMSIWKCRRRTPEELAGLQYITLAAYQPNPALLDLIYQHNRSNTDVRIMVEDYSKYNTESDEDAGIDRFKQDMLSGKVADIICTDNLPFEIMASKGMFEDLTPFMKRDLNMDDYYTNFFAAVSYAGKQQQIGFSFSVRTLAAKQKFVGEGAGYSLSGFIEFMETLPEGVAPFSDADKQIMLQQLCTYNMGAFVDTKKGKCDFDSDEFMQLLEFCNTFPDPAAQPENGTLEWMDLMDKRADDFLNDEAIFAVVSLNGPNDFHETKEGRFGGEDITLTGYPTVEGGNGAVFYPEFLLAMNAQSLYQAEIWEFMKVLLSEEYQRNISFPVMKSVLPDRIAKYLENPRTEWFGGSELIVQMEQPTDGYFEFLEEYLENVTVSDYYNKDIYNIVHEEATMYFAGDQSAEQAAKMIQSRVSIYLSEQS